MAQAQTFDDLGIPFPLFSAPVAEAAEYRGKARCGICNTAATHCFSATSTTGNDLIACYDCLRGGKARISKDTVIGIVGNADSGLADAVGEDRERLLGYGFEVLPHPLEPDEPDWHQVRVPSEHLRELLRTPNFLTFQGCVWHFCCRRPMIYVGTWKELEFEKHCGNESPISFFRRVVTDWPEGEFNWGETFPLIGCGGPYVFQCADCGKYEGYHDMD